MEEVAEKNGRMEADAGEKTAAEELQEIQHIEAKLAELEKEEDPKKQKSSKILTLCGILLSLILLPVLIINIMLIVRSQTHPNEMPSVFGQIPVIVKTGSMSGDQEGSLQVGDMALVKTATKKDLAKGLAVGQVITYKLDDAYITHRITKVDQDDSGFLYTTQGDANNVADQDPVKTSQVIGIVENSIPKLGDIALFMQTPAGMMLCIVLPVLLFVFYDAIRRRYYNRQQQKYQDERKERRQHLQQQLQQHLQHQLQMQQQLKEETR